MWHAIITRFLTRYRLYGTLNDLRWSGYPHVTTARPDQHIRTSHLCNRLQTAVATTAVTLGWTNNRFSAQTVRNRLAERGIKCMRPYHGANATSSMWTYELGILASKLDQTPMELHLVHWWVAVLPSEDRSTFLGLPTSKRKLFRCLRTCRSLWWWKCHGIGQYIIQQLHAAHHCQWEPYRTMLLRWDPGRCGCSILKRQKEHHNLSTGQCQMSYSTCLSWLPSATEHWFTAMAHTFTWFVTHRAFIGRAWSTR